METDQLETDILVADVSEPQPSIRILVKLFAAYQEAYAVPELAWQVPQGTAVGEICDRLIAERPELRPWKELTRFGINLQFVPKETILQEGDEVVLIPPVSGG